MPAGRVKPALALSLHSTRSELRERLLPKAPRIAPDELVGLWQLARLLRRSLPEDAEEIAGGPGRGAAAALGLAWVVAVISGLRLLLALR